MSAEELLDKIMHGEVVTVEGHTLLTGNQWYDRFEKELKSPPYVVSKMYESDGKRQQELFSESHVLEAARKAAGLEEQGDE